MVASLLLLGPPLALLAVLLLGRFPGEAWLGRHRRRWAPRRPRPPAKTAPARPFRWQLLLPRGGALISIALAGRAPPPLRPSIPLHPQIDWRLQ